MSKQLLDIIETLVGAIQEQQRTIDTLIKETMVVEQPQYTIHRMTPEEWKTAAKIHHTSTTKHPDGIQECKQRWW